MQQVKPPLSEFCNKILKQEEDDINAIQNGFIEIKSNIKLNDFLERIILHCEKTIIKYYGILGNRIKKLKQYLEKPIAQEHNTIIDIFKDDQLSLEEITDELQKLNFYVQKDANQELNEYKILNQLASEFYLDYHQLLEYLMNIDQQPYSLLEFFNNQLQKREFIYQFMLHYSKQKIISYEYSQIIGNSVKQLISKLESQIEFKIQLFQSQSHKLFKSQIKFYRVFEQILDILNQIVSYFIDPLQDQYRVYMLMSIKSIIITVTDLYLLILCRFDQKPSKTIRRNNTIKSIERLKNQLSLILKYRIGIKKSEEIAYNDRVIVEINNIINGLMQKLVLTRFYLESKDLQNILKEAEEQWDDILQKQLQLYNTQQAQLKKVLVKRKEQFMSNKNFYCFDPLFHKHQIRLPLTAKEIFKLIFADQDHCFFYQYKKEAILQIELQMEKYNPRPPDFFEYEDCYDMKTFIESRSGCIRSMTYKHPIKERLFYFVPEYANCKQQDEITFITDKEFINQTEVFLHGFPYSDYFSVQNYFYVSEDNSKHSTLMYELILIMKNSFGYKNNILKKTWLEPIFQKKAKEENDLVWNTQLKPWFEKVSNDYLQQNREVQQQQRKNNFIQKYKIKRLINQQIDVKNNALKKESQNQIDLPMINNQNQQQVHNQNSQPRIQSKRVIKLKMEEVLTLALFFICIVLQMVNIYFMRSQ